MTVAAEDVLDVAAEELGVERTAFNLSAPFTSLDVDSLDFASLELALERRFGVELEQADFTRAKTVGDAVGVVLRKANGGPDDSGPD